MDKLFAGWEAPMVRACLEGKMGRVQAAGEASALAVIGDLCFLVGEPSRELLDAANAPILVPGSGDWEVLIRTTLGEGAVPFTRYATRRPPGDRDRLVHFTEALPQGFRLCPIGREMYFTLMGQEWSRDLCGNFAGVEDLLARGLGFAAVGADGEPAAGAASYAVCDGAIEIEIDTRPKDRRRGLALACGARLILECLDRGLYPGWDAHNEQSLSLAEKLGYRLDRPYTAYWVEARAGRGE